MYYTTLKYDFGIFKFSKWPTAAILIFEKASMETTKDSSNFDYGHIQVGFLKFSAFYLFFSFKTLMLLDYSARTLCWTIVQELMMINIY